jgi:hypothetical protein
MVQRLIFLFTKIEHYHEARWWNEVFEFAENEGARKRTKTDNFFFCHGSMNPSNT